ncbi:hypothetical protein ALP66_102406 [Pseudomonas amygdali pv. photiniae]|uniref:Uncharacterized protein n=6 Tax=Pseudomonas syringae group genomosp. 2 TaxID=251698 RepID=A0A3M2ZJ33_PSESS|nr:hypothetical protein AC519_4938 [Pseudomonas savastanoi]KPB65776.1 Unknown protein sequence [Pseudomonas amygdali pv. myricae]KPC57946.1 Unknown protein sequence [Pseudomonas amygdali pv. morsprunorum]KPW75184.1 hypothetical protein ALO78_101873 [Pseudomonas amygdali pv. ciccaronei]KPX08200.1 hypothetical protein ALO74_102121 [Pseudomonas syringae pv. cunninghamiae]KPX22185.1 hypothetical protein ALO71_102062 [Pseudomonas amygdali pv. dendropanacis]KPX22627.1 hypothetical protein ALO70_102
MLSLHCMNAKTPGISQLPDTGRFFAAANLFTDPLTQLHYS